jgi:hypothetical protein
MFSIPITSQIVNLKMVGDVLGLRECYQCGHGGETLVSVVKHSVSDSSTPPKILLGCESSLIPASLSILQSRACDCHPT